MRGKNSTSKTAGTKQGVQRRKKRPQRPLAKPFLLRTTIETERALRSRIMAAVRQKHTEPELAVRSTLHRLGFRYRLHDRSLPGCPDIVLRRHECIVFVNGCFWHQHPGCRRARLPRSNTTFWLPKLQRNRRRDLITHRALRRNGWRVVVVWECQVMRNLSAVGRRLSKLIARP